MSNLVQFQKAYKAVAPRVPEFARASGAVCYINEAGEAVYSVAVVFPKDLTKSEVRGFKGQLQKYPLNGFKIIALQHLVQVLPNDKSEPTNCSVLQCVYKEI